MSGERLQPIEIHPSIQKSLDAWSACSSDGSFSNALLEDGRELGPLNKSLGQASVAWSFSAIFDELAKNPGIMDILRPPPPDIPKDVFFFLQADSLTSNAVVFRTYVSVVLGRTDEFVVALSAISKRNPSEHFSAIMKLLRNNEVRHLRNAIGHGTYIAQGQVMKYRDGVHSRRISFRELDKLNSAIWYVVLTGLTASYRWKEKQWRNPT
ncbi:MAG: hypothetical protein K0B00_06415 [Rhodobacteraceae bacterium]|nr:hypothetical protein [Paracoccaceae bacterium]